MTEVQKLQLDILLRLDAVCSKHNLHYYLAYGTCLGAVRHQGFIPWDHDIDVLMPIADAKKLEKYQKEFGDNYIVTNYRNDKSYRNVNMRIVDKEHECYVKIGDRTVEKTCVFIDIYPFYNCPKTKLALTLRVFRSHIYKMLVLGIPKNHGVLAKIAARIILLFFNPKNRERDRENCEKYLDYQGESVEISDYFGEDISTFTALTYRKEWFSSPSKLNFEGYIFDGPTDPDKYLTKRYGDYMVPTSPQKQDLEMHLELIGEK